MPVFAGATAQRLPCLKQHPQIVAVTQNVAPVPEKPTITVHEAVARKMFKLRANLGITAADLLPASVALESERNDHASSPSSKHQTEVRGDQAEAEAEVGGGSSAAGAAASDSGGRGQKEVSSRSVPDIGRWKKEVDDMLSLLGTNADKCTHEHPMTELKRKVRSKRGRSLLQYRAKEFRSLNAHNSKTQWFYVYNAY